MLNKTNLARIDLNLLVLFEAVFEERHVARAAARLHVSPSAVSHGLGRLRELMQDPLFLRQPKGVVPTERARQLAAPVADILERARQVISRAEKFDPRCSVRRFAIGAPDAVTAAVLPPLLKDLRRDAPGIDLGVRNLIGQFEASLIELDQRTLDVALLPLTDIPARFASRVLFDEDFVLVRRVGHPSGRKFTLAKYAEAAHVMVSVSGDPHGPVDKLLADRGLSRRVMLTVPHFLHALAVVARIGSRGRHAATVRDPAREALPGGNHRATDSADGHADPGHRSAGRDGGCGRGVVAREPRERGEGGVEAPLMGTRTD